MTNISQFRWKRRIVQFATLMLIVLIPATGLFRIDLASASFVVLNHQIWWSSFTLVTGLALIFVTAPILTYMTIGTVWCGWACPQNLVAEFGDMLTHKLLGKRASVRVEGKGFVVAETKNRLLNWMVLGSVFLLASFVIALIPFLLFFSPAYLWEMLTFGDTEKLSTFIFYLLIVFLVFADIAFIRYYLCDYACFYRMGQRMFKTRDALHVTYDATRAADCAKCNYCATVCITSIQPTAIAPHDICINCGECIDACDRLHQKTGTPGLLDFKLSSESANRTWYQKIATVLRSTNRLVLVLFLAGIVLMVWGLVTQPKVLPKIPFAVQQKTREIARICSVQCVQQESACKNRNMEGCYRAAACRCECTLQQDPSNTDSNGLRQCVARNLAHAETERTRITHLPGSKPEQ
jgi:polyferredoxin